MVWGEVFHGAQAVLEEYILKKSSGQDPLYMVGWEGVWGLILTSLLLIPAQLYACPFDESQCINNHADDVFIAIKQFNAKPVLIVYAVCFLVASTMFNGCGIVFTKFSTATNRTIIGQVRVVVIWVFFLLTPGFGHEEFSPEKLSGFTLIMIGILLFNEILVFDGLGIKQKEEKGSEQVETKPNFKLEKYCSDEDSLIVKEEECESFLPKLSLDENQCY